MCASKKKRALAQLGYITAHSRHGTPLRAFPCPAEGTDHLHREDEDSRGMGELGDDTEEKDENEFDLLQDVEEEETCGTDYHCMGEKGGGTC